MVPLSLFGLAKSSLVGKRGFIKVDELLKMFKISSPRGKLFPRCFLSLLFHFLVNVDRHLL